MKTYCAWCCVWGDHRAPECPALRPIRRATEGLARGMVKPWSAPDLESFLNPQPTVLRYQIDSELDFATASLRMQLSQESARISEWIINTKESIIRDALIKLGWTPPS